MSKAIAVLLLSAAVVLPNIASAVPEAGYGQPNTGQCVKQANDARKADGNKANGQNNVTPRSTQIQAIKGSLAEFGACTPPPPPECPPGAICGDPLPG
jgi:hypothetical protein